MKRLPVVGLVSLSMLAATSAQAATHDAAYYAQGEMRPGRHDYTRQEFEGQFKHGTSGPRGTDTYAPEYYAPGTSVRPDTPRYYRQDMGSRRMAEVSGNIHTEESRGTWVGQNGRESSAVYNMGKGHNYKRNYLSTYHTNVRGRKGESRHIGERGNALDTVGIGGHADLDELR